MEGMTGIEPASSAWKAEVLATIRHPHRQKPGLDAIADARLHPTRLCLGTRHINPLKRTYKNRCQVFLEGFKEKWLWPGKTENETKATWGM